jgi:hypothetical protein
MLQLVLDGEMLMDVIHAHPAKLAQPDGVQMVLEEIA